MQEIISQILVLLRGAWRYRWLAVVLAWIIAIGGWIAVQTMPDRYESSTQVYVDTESLLRPLLTGLAVNRDVMSQVAMMQAVMLSRPNLEKVAQQTDMMLAAKTPREQEAVLDSLQRRIALSRSVSRRGGANTFQVSFQDQDPKLAHAVVRTLLDTFMEDSLGLKRTDAGVAQRFLESQIDEYEQKLIQAEQRLADFKQQNVGLMPGATGDYYQRLEAEMGRLQQMQQVYNQLQARRDELNRQLRGEEPSFGLMGGASQSSPIDAQIAQYKAQRDQLMLQYTDKHPQVRSINETIARLEEEKSAGATISSSVAPPSGAAAQVAQSLDANPVYQTLRLNLSQAEADLAEMRGQMGSQQALITQLRSRVNAIPEVEAELARLNRDYEVNKKQYDTLLQRLESARISQQAEQTTENVKFRIIEPPSQPVQPSGPKRLALDTLVLLGALGTGLGLAVLLAQLHPTFTSRDVLEKVTGIPVLGAVTAALRDSVEPWYRRQGVMVAGAFGLLFVAYILNIVLTDHLRSALRNLVG